MSAITCPALSPDRFSLRAAATKSLKSRNKMDDDVRLNEKNRVVNVDIKRAI